MKPKVNLSIRISRRLYKVIMDIRPLFADWESDDPMRGATTRALEYILQHYMESEDYQKKLKTSKDFAKRFFNYLCVKDKEQLKKMLEGVSPSKI